MNERTLFNEQKGSKSDYEYEIFSLKRTGNIKRERESCYTCWYCDLDSAGTATKQVFFWGWVIGRAGNWCADLIQWNERWLKISSSFQGFSHPAIEVTEDVVLGCLLFIQGHLWRSEKSGWNRVKSACCQRACEDIRKLEPGYMTAFCFALLLVSFFFVLKMLQTTQNLVDFQALHFNQSLLLSPDPFLHICFGDIKMHEKLPRAWERREILRDGY